MNHLPYGQLVDFGVAFLVGKGVEESAAAVIANIAVKAQATGSQTHGLKMLPYFEETIGIKDPARPPFYLDAAARPQLIFDGPATAVFDGHRCFGPLAVKEAIKTGIGKARQFGIAMVGVRNTTWMGSLGVYMMELAEAGFLGQLWSQSSSCELAAPLGGIEPRFGTNPVCVAIPAHDAPIVADISTTATSGGKSQLMMERGEKAEAPIFMDKAGRHTNDPAVRKDGGSILFIGGADHGHKGYGLSFYCEALVAMMGGKPSDSRIADCNFNLLVIDPKAFGAADAFEAERERFIKSVKASKPRHADHPVRLPGERAAQTLKHSLISGVPVSNAVLAEINELARRNGLAPLSVAQPDSL
jgi:LDH2 family malate/lactate/ureidoglycolate dehydrogenase